MNSLWNKPALPCKQSNENYHVYIEAPKVVSVIWT